MGCGGASLNLLFVPEIPTSDHFLTSTYFTYSLTIGMGTKSLGGLPSLPSLLHRACQLPQLPPQAARRGAVAAAATAAAGRGRGLGRLLADLGAAEKEESVGALGEAVC